MCCARDPHFQPRISVPKHIIFTNYKQIRSGASPIYFFWGGFCCSGDHYLKNLFHFNPFIASHRRLSPNAKCSAAPRVSSRPVRESDASGQFRRLAFSRSKLIKLVLEPRIFTLKTDQARSGAPHFQAQNGSSSFRSPAFSHSTGSSFRSPGPFFTLPRHIPIPIFGVSTPPPPRVSDIWYATAACVPCMLACYLYNGTVYRIIRKSDSLELLTLKNRF